jgi:hypothetical protein
MTLPHQNPLNHLPTQRSITPQHALDKITQRTPKVLTAVCQSMLINEQDIVLEARIEMRLETQLNDDVVVVAVYVRVHAVQALEHVADQSGERLWKRHADAGREHGFVVYVGLDPGHEVLDVFGRRHFGGLLVRLGVLPQILEPGSMYVRFDLRWGVDGLLVCCFHLWAALRGAEFRY